MGEDTTKHPKHGKTEAPGADEKVSADKSAADKNAAADKSAPAGKGSRGAGKKKSSPRRIISTLLIVVGIGLLLVAGGIWGYQQYSYYKQDEINKKLATHVKIQDDKEDCPVTVDWAALEAVNGDVCGWLYVPGTTINYPVYQGKDNEHYLRHNAEGDWTIGGQLFLDYENTRPGLVDSQSLVYGHHLLDGSMFEQLAAMDNQDRFNEIGTVWYVTKDHNYEMAPLFMYFTQPDDVNARTFNFASEEEFRAYLQERYGRAVTKSADAEKAIKGVTHLMTFSTCNYYDGYGRSLLVCAPKDEIEAALAAA